MYHVFNMGVGMVIVSAPENVDKLTKKLTEIMVIGEVVKRAGDKRIIID